MPATTRIPTAVRAVRVVLFLAVPVSGTVALRFAVAGATVRSGAFGEPAMGLLFLEALPFAVPAVMSLVVALKIANGGNGVRAGAVAAGRLVITAGVVGALAHHMAWSAGALLGAVLLFLATGPDTRHWFDTPRL
ncbi:hypothetical protein ACFCYB_40035 [Streptomyces sp. NPDC056309]|uniref:hypothetical protein n=1 Tax=unclassified Streptomyces TaxID=2593676 RepID=UPI0035E11EFF